MASLAILLPCASVLIGTALAVSLAAGRSSILNPGPHGFSESCTHFPQPATNNGVRLPTECNTWFYNLTLGLVMLIGRFGVLISRAGDGRLIAAKRKNAKRKGTLPLIRPSLFCCS